MLSLLCVSKLRDNRCVRLSVSTLTALPITTQFGKRGGSPHKTKKCRLHITRVTTHLSRLVLRQLGPAAGSSCRTGCAAVCVVWQAGRPTDDCVPLYCTPCQCTHHCQTGSPVCCGSRPARRAARLYILYSGPVCCTASPAIGRVKYTSLPMQCNNKCREACTATPANSPTFQMLNYDVIQFSNYLKNHLNKNGFDTIREDLFQTKNVKNCHFHSRQDS